MAEELGAKESSRLIERRAHVRVRREFHAKCVVVRGGQPMHSTRTLEISSGGIRVEHRQEIAPGAQVDVTFDDPAVSSNFTVRGVVAWTLWHEKRRGYETGIEFLDLSPAQRESVLQIIGRSLEDDLVEQRRVVRLAKRLSVRLWPAKTWLARRTPAWTVDIGLGGAALVAERAYETGTLCHVEIELPGQKDRASAEGLVLACNRRADGKWHLRLQFQELEDADLRRIRRFLATELQRPAP